MPAPKTIIISATDDLYASLANDLYLSIKSRSYKNPFDLGLLDVGLSANSAAYFAGMGIRVEKAESDIDYPARDYWEAKRPGLRTLTARPFLRRYFPGYDVYIWIDADAWVQTPEAIDVMSAEAALSPAIHLSCELDRCYTPFFESGKIWETFAGWYQGNFPPDISASMILKPMLNAGVFAMRQDLPVWDAWAAIYAQSLQNITELNEKSFMADQLGLNILLYLHGLPCVLMPVHYNWLTYFALPKLDTATGLLVEPLPPYRPISHIHLTRPQKNAVEKIQCLDGTVIERVLTYSAQQIRSVRDVKVQAGAFLQIADHAEQIFGLRIAARSEHADQAFGRRTSRSAKPFEADGRLDIIAHDRLAGVEVAA